MMNASAGRWLKSILKENKLTRQECRVSSFFENRHFAMVHFV